MRKIKLTVELVPKGSWNKNLRSILPKEKWDEIRKWVYKKANYRCEICGGVGEKWPVECHERWSYNIATKTQKLVGFYALCPKCHEIKHLGFSILKGGDVADKLRHLTVINKWTYPEALKYIDTQWELYYKRSKVKWKLDLSLLDKFKIKWKAYV